MTAQDGGEVTSSPEGGPSSRLFVALWPDDPASQALQRWMACWQWPRQARVVPAGKLHLTLHFLGQVPDRRLPELAAGLRVETEALELDFGTVRTWGHGLVALEPLARCDALFALHAEVAAALRRLGLTPEPRPLRPHVTLARQAAGAVAPSEPLRLRWRSDGYALVQSGDGYRNLARYPAQRRQ